MMRIAARLVVALLLALPAAAAANPIEPFVGRFEGKSTAAGDGSQRDLTVVIAGESQNAFSIDWKTVIRRSDGTDDQRHERVKFLPTKRPNIYSAGSKVDMFGKLVPIDPILGDAYYWARIRDRTLSVFNILVTEDGGYEMQVYHRTLSSDGKTMKVEFRRVRDGDPLRTVTGELKRTK
jgi:hypothetical protein